MNQDDQQGKGNNGGGGKKGKGKGKKGKGKGKGGQKGGQQFNGQCNNCGEYGHKSIDCPNPPQAGGKGKKGPPVAPIGAPSPAAFSPQMNGNILSQLNGNATSFQMPSIGQMQQQLFHLQQREQQQQQQQYGNGGNW